jgi:hypothetical protein
VDTESYEEDKPYNTFVGYMTINGGDYWICQNSWVTLGEGMKDYLW